MRARTRCLAVLGCPGDSWSVIICAFRFEQMKCQLRLGLFVLFYGQHVDERIPIEFRILLAISAMFHGGIRVQFSSVF